VKPKVEVKKPANKPAVKPTVKPVKKPTASKKAPKSVASGTYYVQVGSFKDNPSARFLSVIKSSGFTYHVTNPDRTGYKKLLIGPYKTRELATTILTKVKDEIEKDAFIAEIR